MYGMNIFFCVHFVVNLDVCMHTVSNSKGVLSYTPITDFLSMQVAIIDFANLNIGINPIGTGSTCMVYPALLNKSQLVAVKVFCLDNITIKAVADFFRETLLSSNIKHANIVSFIGCCIRPPEICLIYEICSHGDLASFIFASSKDLNNRDAMKQFDDEQIDIHYLQCQPQTMLSENTTIPSMNSPMFPSMISPEKNRKIFESPTENFIESDFARLNDANDDDDKKRENVPCLSLCCRLLLLLDISKGMEFLHKMNMIHRDLKTSNVLIHYESEQSRFVAKVCDFGSSRYVNSEFMEPQSNTASKRSKRELSLTNFKKAQTKKQTKQYQKDRSMKKSFFARLKASNPAFDYNETSCSMTKTCSNSIRYDAKTADDGHLRSKSMGKWKNRQSLLPEARNLSAVAFTAPENLRHIDFTGYENEKKFEKNKFFSFENGDCELSLGSDPMESAEMDKSLMCDDVDVDVDLQTALKSDVYSFGIIIWEVICMKPVYSQMSMIEIRDFVLSGKRIKLVEFDRLVYVNKHSRQRKKEQMQYDKLHKVMLDCLQQNAKFRPNFQEIVKTLHSIVYTGKYKCL